MCSGKFTEYLSNQPVTFMVRMNTVNTKKVATIFGSQKRCPHIDQRYVIFQCSPAKSV